MASAEYDKVLEHVTKLFSYRPAPEAGLAERVAGSRRIMAECARVDGVAPALHSATSIVPIAVGDVACEWVRAEGASCDIRLCWIHGGGWIAGRPAEYRNVTEALSRHSGASVLAVGYRLAPEHPFPAALDDCVQSIEWLFDNGPAGPAPAHTLWVAGDSAGANLALAALLRLRSEFRRLPDAAATIGAATDLTASGKSMHTRASVDPMISKAMVDVLAPLYVQNGTPLTHPYVSPLFGELEGLPPLLMHAGDREVLLDDTLRFAERARAAGVEVRAKVWPEMIHVFECFCHVLAEARQSLEEIGAFLRSHGAARP